MSRTKKIPLCAIKFEWPVRGIEIYTEVCSKISLFKIVGKQVANKKNGKTEVNIVSGLHY